MSPKLRLNLPARVRSSVTHHVANSTYPETETQNGMSHHRAVLFTCLFCRLSVIGMQDVKVNGSNLYQSRGDEDLLFDWGIKLD